MPIELESRCISTYCNCSYVFI